jgi:AcrR family transcriptional regulator
VTAVEPSGLRERKRLRTRREIARAALELFDRHGFHETTIPQIAEAADVSPRTVSAYFPHKEDLAFPEGEEGFESLAARLRGRAPDETAAEALRAWLETWLALQAGREEELQVQRRVIAADEALRAYEQRIMLRVQDLMADAIARDLGVSPGNLEARMAAAATLTIFSLLGDDAERLPPAEALALVDRALLFIGAGIAALRGGDAG